MKITQTEPVTDCRQVINYLHEKCEFTHAELAVLFVVTPLTVRRWHSGEMPMNKEHASAAEGLLDYLSVMRVSLEARKMFASGYLQGRMSHGK